MNVGIGARGNLDIVAVAGGIHRLLDRGIGAAAGADVQGGGARHTDVTGASEYGLFDRHQFVPHVLRYEGVGLVEGGQCYTLVCQRVEAGSRAKGAGDDVGDGVKDGVVHTFHRAAEQSVRTGHGATLKHCEVLVHIDTDGPGPRLGGRQYCAVAHHTTHSKDDVGLLREHILSRCCSHVGVAEVIGVGDECRDIGIGTLSATPIALGKGGHWRDFHTPNSAYNPAVGHQPGQRAGQVACLVCSKRQATQVSRGALELDIHDSEKRPRVCQCRGRDGVGCAKPNRDTERVAVGHTLLEVGHIVGGRRRGVDRACHAQFTLGPQQALITEPVKGLIGQRGLVGDQADLDGGGRRRGIGRGAVHADDENCHQ